MYHPPTTDSDYITESMSETETETELDPTTDTKTEPNTSDEEGGGGGGGSCDGSGSDIEGDGVRNSERGGRGRGGSPGAGSAGRSSNTKITLFDLSEDEFQELQETIYDLAEDFLKNEGSAMTVIGFKDKMSKHISDIMLDDLIESEIFTYDHYEDIIQICKDVIDIYFDSMQIPDYVVIDADAITLLDRGSTAHRRRMREQIEYLRKQPQPTQKSEEWYRERHTLLTASNIWKAVGSPAQQNSLIAEKCTPFVLQPYQQASVSGGGGGYCNTASPMHWGNKYEPLTRMVYEDMYKTIVEDFGCIKHPQYPFIGASPDGINVDPESPRYGRMLEIKNIVNRDITGIPLEKYWIQVQIQLETCGLNLCDFVETRFKEYRREEFYRDIAAGADTASDPTTHHYRGIILYFLEGRAGAPIYEYMPLWVKHDPTVIQNWTDAQIAAHASQGHTLFDTLYWFLDEYSCVTIERNRIWFDEIARPKLIVLKSTIDRESVSGFQHRISSKTAKIPKITPSVCLIKLDAP